MNKLFTIGYSCYDLQPFLKTLKDHGVTALADVRSQPFSRYKPEFNKDTISKFLLNNGINYVFLGNECGARIKAPECYINGRADYSQIAKHPLFRRGLKRIMKGLESQTISLMCAEKDPLKCHRAILVCRNLKDSQIEIEHILWNGTIETHADLEKRLLKMLGLDLPDLFKNEETKLMEAYQLQGNSIAYIDEPNREGINQEGIQDDDALYDRFYKKVGT